MQIVTDSMAIFVTKFGLVADKLSDTVQTEGTLYGYGGLVLTDSVELIESIVHIERGLNYITGDVV